MVGGHEREGRYPRVKTGLWSEESPGPRVTRHVAVGRKDVLRDGFYCDGVVRKRSIREIRRHQLSGKECRFSTLVRLTLGTGLDQALNTVR